MKTKIIPDFLYLVLYSKNDVMSSKILKNINDCKSFINLSKKNNKFKLISTLEYNFSQEVLVDYI